MKINFLRLGFANNSSSSHSIIFTNTKLKDYQANGDYGWNRFTLRTREAKAGYLMACFRDTFTTFLSKKECNKDIDSDQLNVYFNNFIKKRPALNEIAKISEVDINECGVDHQSVIYFPLHRLSSRGINLSLAVKLMREIIDKPYAILGGNDNDREVHFARNYDEKYGENVKILLKFLRETPTLSAYDEKTDEFIISSKEAGNIIKISL